MTQNYSNEIALILPRLKVDKTFHKVARQRVVSLVGPWVLTRGRNATGSRILGCVGTRSIPLAHSATSEVSSLLYFLLNLRKMKNNLRHPIHTCSLHSSSSL